MTLDRLAVAVRGMLRDALMLIDTPEGSKPIRSVSYGYGRCLLDGSVQQFPTRSAIPEGWPYVIVLSTERL
ncbi:hypothetical protein [Acidisphaera sp. S103]|uniref:hypothetical protein n=1 Tax=Acidisphaera sp. S103 TaxID=1747223 RepID=UPI00131BF38B|nr:hypothetical protein [Acidisphaera sp. S103]